MMIHNNNKMMTVSNGNTVTVNGNVATINGKRYTLPSYRSIALSNSDIILDGKRWVPPRPKPSGPLMKKTFVISTSEADKTDGVAFTRLFAPPSSFDVFGAWRVYVSESDDDRSFKATLEIEAPDIGRAKTDYRRIDTSRVREVETCIVRLELPRAIFRQLTLDRIVEVAEIGDVTAGDMSLVVRGGTPELSVQNSWLKSMTVSYGSGKCVLNDVTCPTVHLMTVGADIEVLSSCIDRCSVETMSGDVSISTTKIEKPFSVNTMSGDVNLYEARCHGGTIATMSGDVSIIERAPDSLGSVNVRTMSGDLSGSTYSPIRFSTASGSDQLKRSKKRAREDEDDGSKKKKKRVGS
jgi:hypothetical protein